MNDRTYDQLLRFFLVTFIGAHITFAAFPGIDIAVSRGFVDVRGVFHASEGPTQILNDMLRALMELVAFVVVFGTLVSGLMGRLRGAVLRCWVFVVLNLVLAPGLIVNLILKSHLGRARPVSLTDFGGTAIFTPAWQISDQCPTNCSFTSGEVSLAASLAICVVVLLWPRLSARGRGLALLLATADVVLEGVMRISLGRHFLSDAVFSIFVSGAVALTLYPMLDIGRARLAFTFPALPTRVRAVAGDLLRHFRKPLP